MSIYLGDTKIGQCNVVFNDGVDTNVSPENIKTGIHILGVDGTFTESGTQSAGQEVATSDDIVDGKSAWADGQEVMGNLIINNYYVGNSTPSTSLGVNGDIYLQINNE